ncbi:MAG: leucine-rich repeat domain-containing protein [Promethearchaeota archaeon]
METINNLKELQLGSNIITEIKGLETLTSLQIFDLDVNRMKEIEELEHLIHLCPGQDIPAL